MLHVHVFKLNNWRFNISLCLDASLNTDSEYVDTSKELLSSAAAGSSPVSKLVSAW